MRVSGRDRPGGAIILRQPGDADSLRLEGIEVRRPGALNSKVLRARGILDTPLSDAAESHRVIEGRSVGEAIVLIP